MTEKQKSQLDRFKEASRELECDDDDERFDSNLKRLAKAKPEKNAKSGK